MLREIGHFLWHAPATLWLKARVSQTELYDIVLERWDERGMAARRDDLVRGASGEVLEIGSGTGLMFERYAAAVHLTALEPDPNFAARAVERRKKAQATIELLAGTAESIPCRDTSFDAVVSALVLCSVSSQDKALAEIRRVLRPGGELRVLEHVRSPHPVAGALMRAFDPIWLVLNGQGCHCSRNTEAAIKRAGFQICRRETFQIFSPGLPAFPIRLLVATTGEPARQ